MMNYSFKRTFNTGFIGMWMVSNHIILIQITVDISESGELSHAVLLKNILFVFVGADTTVSQSLLTQQGVPVIGLSNGKSYCFSSSLETW